MLQSIPGVKFKKMARNGALHRCCGAGGGVKAVIPGLARDCAKARVVDVVELMAQAMGLDTTIPENPYSKYQEQDVITCSAPEAEKEAIKEAVVAAAK